MLARLWKPGDCQLEVEEVPGESRTISVHCGLVPFHFLPSIQPRTDWPMTVWPGEQLNTATVLLNSSSSSTFPLEGGEGD